MDRIIADESCTKLMISGIVAETVRHGTSAGVNAAATALNHVAPDAFPIVLKTLVDAVTEAHSQKLEHLRHMLAEPTPQSLAINAALMALRDEGPARV